MKVATTQPFQLIYAILNHEYLGYLLETFVVQLNSRGELTLLNQNISSKNVAEFASRLDETDLELVRLIDGLQQDAVLKKFNTKKLPPATFFSKVYDPVKGDPLLQEAIRSFVEQSKAHILSKLANKPIFIMGQDGNPTWRKVEWKSEQVSVRFHFARNPDNTHYYPTLRYQGERLEWQYKNAFVLCEEPAWLVVEDSLYHFAKNVDGKKLRPFLNKKFIIVPRNIEEQYYQKFVLPLVASFDVAAKGFTIQQEQYPAQAVLILSEQKSAGTTASLFADSGSVTDEASEQMLLELFFRYGEHTFRFDNFANDYNVFMQKTEDSYLFQKVKRQITFEKKTIKLLQEWGLPIRGGRVGLPKAAAFEWVQANLVKLQEAEILVNQNHKDTKRYFLGQSTLSLSIVEGNDWFDIQADVQFGEYKIPFVQLRKYIVANKKEFTLPDGQIAVIPDSWFTTYSELFALSQPHEGEGTLSKQHMMLVQQLSEDNLVKAVLSRRLEQLRDFRQVADYTPPEGFVGVLRPYQKAGYDWLRFLNEYRFGGCLADDMGLGKTIQTLALLQSEKEKGVRQPSLLIMPTSLLYNWMLEAEKFTPQLRVFSYTGTYREKNTALFDQYDLILTSYGIARIDVELLKTYRFHYVILDESQAIKNPGSIVAQAVTQLQSAHRLILTGTPLENSTLDLWSQMNFINPGLLGDLTFFKKNFLWPIEKKNDPTKIQRLFGLIKPFILRRLKSQVADDLPEKVESIDYCLMTDAQEQQYEEAKSYYRNMILEQIDTQGIGKTQFLVLQGLTKLRQLANHPRLLDPESAVDSGKFEDILHRVETALGEGHKILLFSQFVKYLSLFRAYFDERQLPYAYLDGSTTDRQKQVARFQDDTSVKLFLISLKAGGVGLNLTAADYVFILDPWWNPAVEAQAIDRAHRIGQDKTVFTYKFITKNTVEEKIMALQQRKKQLASELISNEEGFVKSLTREDVLLLLE